MSVKLPFKIQRTRSGKKRLIARSRLSATDFRVAASKMGSRLKARKKALIAARKAERREAIETRWNGKETSSTARKGDWIVTALSPRRTALRDQDGALNVYVIRAAAFPGLYARMKGSNKFGKFFKAKGLVKAVYFSGGFDIVAPWGQRQRATTGYLLLNGKEVYGNHVQTFEATYKVLA